jgi:hypothetical protein
VDGADSGSCPMVALMLVVLNLLVLAGIVLDG